MSFVVFVDYVALCCLMVAYVIGWIAYSLLQNRRIIIDNKRIASMCVGVIGVLIGWYEFILLRE